MNSPFLSAAGWDGEVAKMINTFGAQIDQADAKTIADYLAKNYGNESLYAHTTRSAEKVGKAWARILERVPDSRILMVYVLSYAAFGCVSSFRRYASRHANLSYYIASGLGCRSHLQPRSGQRRRGALHQRGPLFCRIRTGKVPPPRATEMQKAPAFNAVSGPAGCKGAKLERRRKSKFRTKTPDLGAKGFELSAVGHRRLVRA
jgi:hypothetical protein